MAVDESWEPIHQRLMQTFWDSINVNAERVQSDLPPAEPGKPPPKRKEFNIETPEGFPPGSQQFFENFAHAIVRVKMEAILRNLADAAMTAVAKELSEQYRR